MSSPTSSLSSAEVDSQTLAQLLVVATSLEDLRWLYRQAKPVWHADKALARAFHRRWGSLFRLQRLG